MNIEAATRELLRTIMREMGIRHKSKPRYILSICYADYPQHSVEYIGPLSLRYEDTERGPVVRARVCGPPGNYITAVVSKYLRDHTILPRVLAEFSLGGIEAIVNASQRSAILVKREHGTQELFKVEQLTFNTVANTVFEVADPEFDTKLRHFITANMKHARLRPTPYKVLAKLSERAVVFVDDHRTNHHIFRRLCQSWRWWFGVCPSIQSRYEHAIRRCFNASAAQMAAVTELVEDMRYSSRQELEADTATVMVARAQRKCRK